MYAANNYAFEFDSVLGDLENMDSIASFPSEAKSQCMVSGRSHINIHVDCRGHQTSPPQSASTIPLQITPGACTALRSTLLCVVCSS